MLNNWLCIRVNLLLWKFYCIFMLYIYIIMTTKHHTRSLKFSSYNPNCPFFHLVNSPIPSIEAYTEHNPQIACILAVAKKKYLFHFLFPMCLFCCFRPQKQNVFQTKKHILWETNSIWGDISYIVLMSYVICNDGYVILHGGFIAENVKNGKPVCQDRKARRKTKSEKEKTSITTIVVLCKQRNSFSLLICFSWCYSTLLHQRWKCSLTYILFF